MMKKLLYIQDYRNYLFLKRNFLKLIMKIFVLLYNPNSNNEGIHSIELKGRTIVLMFEEKDDAERYVGLLEAQDFPTPSIESVNLEEIKEFCNRCDYETRIVTKDFVPKTLEDRLLLTPPQKNLEVDKWEDRKNNDDNLDDIRENLEKLL